MNGTRARAWFVRADTAGRAVENALLVVGVSALIVVASGQILLRNVFSIGLVWADGMLRLTVLWLALLGAIAASREGRHIRIDIVARFLGPRSRLVLAFMRELVTAAVCAVLAWYAWAFVADSREFGDVLLGNLPAWWFQIILPVGFAVMAYRHLLGAVLVTSREGG